MDADSNVLQQWIARREPEAFRALVSRYSNMVYATCRRVTGNAADAEDAAQESFQALAMLPAPPKAALGPWLHRVAVNKSLNLKRTDQRRDLRDRSYASQAVPEAVVWDDLYLHVDEAIAALPDKYKTALLLHFLQGETQEAIATRLGVTRQTVAYRIQCGLEGIRKSLKRRGIVALAPALSALLTAHAAEAAPATLLESLGKIAFMGAQVPVLRPSLLERTKVALIPTKGTAAVLVAIALTAALVAGVVYLPGKLTALKNASVRTPGSAPAPALPPAPPLIPPEFEAAPAPETTAPILPTTEVPEMGMVQGCLLSESGEAQAGATVTLTRQDALRWGSFDRKALQWTTTTDANGNFAFPDLPLCADNILCGRQHFYLTAATGTLRAEKLLETVFWETFRYQDLVLRPVTFIDCTVLDGQGMPVSTATITMENAAQNAIMPPFPEKTAVDAEGRAHMGPLPPGAHKLTVRAPGYGDVEQLVTPDTGKANITLTPTGLFCGRALDAENGLPVADAELSAPLPWKTPFLDHTMSTAEGDFAFSTKDASPLLLFARKEELCLPGGWAEVPVNPDRGRVDTLQLVHGGTLSGRALDPVTGNGVAHIPVCFTYDKKQTDYYLINTHTDEEGKYTLKGICGKGTIRMLDWWDPACVRAVEVAAGQEIADVDFALPKQCRIAGHVTGAHDAPVAGAVVAATAIADKKNIAGKKDVGVILRYMVTTLDDVGCVTDENGRFVCFLQGNMGRVYMQALGGDCASQKVGPINVPESGITGLVLHAEPTGGVRGRVLDAQSRPVPRASVVLQPVDATRNGFLFGREWPGQASMTDIYPVAAYHCTEMGYFAFRNLLPGRYRVMAFLQASPGGTPLATREVDITAGADQDLRLNIATASLGSIRGRVSSANGPMANLTVAVLGNTIEKLSAVTAQDGFYTLEQLPPGRVQLNVANTTGADSLATASVTVTAGQTVTVDIAVPLGTGRVEGTVRVDGVPAAGKAVYLTPFDGARGQSFTVVTDAQGQYVIADVVAGTYELGLAGSGAAGASPTQSLTIVRGRETLRHDFDTGGGVLFVAMENMMEDDRGHIVVVPGEVILEEVTEAALMALAPQAVKYVRTNGDAGTYTLSGLASGLYTVFGAAHPRAVQNPAEAVRQMRVLYSVVKVAAGAPVPVTFDFASASTPEHASDTEPTSSVTAPG